MAVDDIEESKKKDLPDYLQAAAFYTPTAVARRQEAEKKAKEKRP